MCRPYRPLSSNQEFPTLSASFSITSSESSFFYISFLCIGKCMHAFSSQASAARSSWLAG
jgi:hypothetical protein